MDKESFSFKDMVQTIMSSFSWVLFFALFVLSIIVFISQNSAPGDKTYAVKLGLEKALVKASRVMNNEATVQIELTKRRVQETEKVIASNHASESLTNLSNQVSTTEQTILTIKDPQKQQDAAKKYIATLSTTKDVLENEKQQILTSNATNTSDMKEPTATVMPTIRLLFSPSPTQKLQEERPTLTLTPTKPPTIATVTAPTTITTQISETQDQISNTITTLNNLGKKTEKEHSNNDNEDQNNKDNKKD